MPFKQQAHIPHPPCLQKGKTLIDKLRELEAAYGYHTTFNSYYICRDPRTIDTIFAAIRKV